MMTQPSSTLTPRASDSISPKHMTQNLWRHRMLIWQLIKREVSQRYRASYLGLGWAFLTPLLLLLVYTFVFSVVLKTSWRGEVETPPEEFALIVFSGLAAFSVFSDVISRAPSLVLAVPNYVKKVIFPLEVLPVVALGTALINSGIMVSAVFVGHLLLAHSISATFFLLPLMYLPLVLLCLGLGWFLASLGVYVRDVGQGIGLLVQMIFFLSGVFYPITIVPEPFRSFMLLNPLATIIIGFRQILLWGEMPHWGWWAVWTLLASLFAWLAYIWFFKTKKGFADVM